MDNSKRSYNEEFRELIISMVKILLIRDDSGFDPKDQELNVVFGENDDFVRIIPPVYIPYTENQASEMFTYTPEKFNGELNSYFAIMKFNFKPEEVCKIKTVPEEVFLENNDQNSVVQYANFYNEAEIENVKTLYESLDRFKFFDLMESVFNKSREMAIQIEPRYASSFRKIRIPRNQEIKKRKIKTLKFE